MGEWAVLYMQVGDIRRQVGNIRNSHFAEHNISAVGSNGRPAEFLAGNNGAALTLGKNLDRGEIERNGYCGGRGKR